MQFILRWCILGRELVCLEKRGVKSNTRLFNPSIIKALRKGPHEVETKELFLSFQPFFQVGVHSDAPF
jgi:hypothetical protein